MAACYPSRTGHHTPHPPHRWALQGDNPVYVWVPLSRFKKKRKAVGPAEDEELSDLQVQHGSN